MVVTIIVDPRWAGRNVPKDINISSGARPGRSLVDNLSTKGPCSVSRTGVLRVGPSTLIPRLRCRGQSGLRTWDDDKVLSFRRPTLCSSLPGSFLYSDPTWSSRTVSLPSSRPSPDHMRQSLLRTLTDASFTQNDKKCWQNIWRIVTCESFKRCVTASQKSLLRKRRCLL